MDVNFIFNYSVIKCLSSQKKQEKRKKGMGGLVGKTFYYYFLTGEKKVNPQLRCPSINQLKRNKLSTRKNTDTLT